MKNLKISVVMCTYNGEKYIREQLDSIINQTYPVYELIIQDDLSSDNTFSILKEYERQHAFIHVFRNEMQQGISRNFFSAMQRATGDYIAISDQDDIWMPDKIEQQIPFAKAFSLVTGGSLPFAGDEEAEVFHDQRDVNVHLERLIYNCAISGHTFLFHKELLEKIPDKNLWSQTFLYDHLLAIVAATHGNIKYLPQILVKHRRLIHSATYNKPLNYERSPGNMLRILCRTVKQYRKLHPAMAGYFSHIYALMASLDIQNKRKENAMRLAKYQQSANPVPLALFCVQLRDRIFYAPEKNRLLSVLRALYFPISCTDYFRYML